MTSSQVDLSIDLYRRAFVESYAFVCLSISFFCLHLRRSTQINEIFFRPSPKFERKKK